MLFTHTESRRPEEKQLWLGESKLYTSGTAGIKALAADLQKHLEADYLRQEFELSVTKLPVNAPDVEHWRALMHEHTRLDAILDKVCIPMICTYTSDLYAIHSSGTQAYIDAFLAECAAMKALFDEHTIATDVDVVLILLPVQSKLLLVQELDKRLKNMQSI